MHESLTFTRNFLKTAAGRDIPGAERYSVILLVSQSPLYSRESTLASRSKTNYELTEETRYHSGPSRSCDTF